MNIACLDDCLHHDNIRYEQNGQRISLDKLATKYMGKNVACLAYVNGKKNVDDWQQKVSANDNVVFTALAMGGDKGGKDAFRMIAQIALLVAVTVASGGLGTALAAATGGFLTVATATQLVAASLLFVGNLAINALLPASGAQEAEQYKTLNPQNNLARVGQAVGEVFGEMKVYPDMIAVPHTSFGNNKPSLSEVFHFTAGDAEISDLRLGTTPIANFSDLSVTTTNNGNVVTKFEVPEARGIELLMPRDDGLPAQNLWGANEGFTPWFDLCPPKEVLNGDGFIDQRFEISLAFAQGVGEFSVASPAPSDIENYDYYDGIKLEWRVVDDVGLPNGATGATQVRVPLIDGDAGGTESYSASVLFIDPTLVLAANSSYTLGDGVQSISPAMTDKRVQVRLRREVEKADNSNDATSVSIISLNGYGEVAKNVDGVIANLHAGQMKRLPMNGGMTLNGIVKRKIYTFKKTGANFEYDALKFSNTPSMVIYHLLHEHYGSFAEVKKHVDLDALWFLHQLNLTKGETFNARITTQKRFWDWLVQIGFGMRVQPIRRGARITFIRDMAGGLPNFGANPAVAGQAINLFNPFHIVRDSFGVTYDALSSDDVHDGVKLEFIDKRVWEYNDYILNLNGTAICDNPLVVDAKGVTDLATIKAIATHMVAAMNYRKINVSFKTEYDGNLASVGNSVLLQNGLIDEGATEQIFAVDGLTIYLEQKLTKDYEFAILRLGEARASQRINVIVADDGLSVSLADAPKVDGVEVDIVSFADVPESPDTIAFYNIIDDEPCTIKITNITYLKNGTTISGFVDDARVYAA